MNPRRTIALGPPYDNGKVPAPPDEETVEDRMDRIERMMDRLDDTIRIIRTLQLEREP